MVETTCVRSSVRDSPPECFAKLGADQAKQFEAYFEDVELRRRSHKTKRGASYVVKTFSLTDDGAQKRPTVRARGSVGSRRLLVAGALLFRWSLASCSCPRIATTTA